MKTIDEKAKELFELFCAKDSLRPWMKNPQPHGGYIYATDSHSLIRVKEDLISKKYESETDTYFPNIIPVESDDITITADNLRKLIAEAPLVNETIDNTQECEACDGDGEVEWEFFSGHTYYMDDDCPVCQGKGEIGGDIPTGRMIPDPEFRIKLDKTYFSALLINKLIRSMEIAEVKECTRTNTDIKSGNKFTVGYFEVLLMPMLPPEE